MLSQYIIRKCYQELISQLRCFCMTLAYLPAHDTKSFLINRFAFCWEFSIVGKQLGIQLLDSQCIDLNRKKKAAKTRIPLNQKATKGIRTNRSKVSDMTIKHNKLLWNEMQFLHQRLRLRERTKFRSQSRNELFTQKLNFSSQTRQKPIHPEGFLLAANARLFLKLVTHNRDTGQDCNDCANRLNPSSGNFRVHCREQGEDQYCSPQQNNNAHAGLQ